MLIYICSTQCDGFGDTQVSDGISVTDTPYHDSTAGPCWLLQGSFSSLEIIVFIPSASVGKKPKDYKGIVPGPPAGLVAVVCSQPKACSGFGMEM